MRWFLKHTLAFHVGLVISVFLILLVSNRVAHASEAGTEPGTEQAEERSPFDTAARMLAAALALGLAAISTSIAQARIGAAAVGALAENPKLFGNLLIFLVVPETLVILGFVIAALMIF
jgi:V/A-type H+-transporting ATPase subunit K